MSLQSIHTKLSELVKLQADKAEAAKPKEPTEEEKDEERLREVEAKLTDLLDLLSGDVTRESADAKIKTAEDRVESTKGEPAPFLRVFHDHGGKKIKTTRRTQVLPLHFLVPPSSKNIKKRSPRCTWPRPSSSASGWGSTPRTWSTPSTSW